MEKKILLNENQYNLLFENDNQKFIDEIKNLINSGQIENIENALQMGIWLKAEGIFDVEKYLKPYQMLIDFISPYDEDIQDKKFTEQIAYLSEIEELLLASSRIVALPYNIGVLKNLKYFWAEGNDLSNLPSSFFTLENLEILDLGDNNFTNLPIEIKNLKSLKELYLMKNPISLEERGKIERLLPNTLVY
jgi:Leucine-rich repeat (LRR) protein